MIIYLIGSLRNPEVPKVGNYLRSLGHEVVDDWYSTGPEADDKWREYEIQRKRSYKQALKGIYAKHVFAFDFYHFNRADVGVMILPTGRSGHLELGYIVGSGKPGYIVLGGEYDRWDVMYQFADEVFDTVEELGGYLNDSQRSGPSVVYSGGEAQDRTPRLYSISTERL